MGKLKAVYLTKEECDCIAHELDRISTEFPSYDQAMHDSIKNKLYDDFEIEKEAVIDGLKLVKTLSRMPEQYDVFDDSGYIGYMRLRGGFFSVDYIEDTVVYEAQSDGDGEFMPYERLKFLKAGVAAIKEKMAKK